MLEKYYKIRKFFYLLILVTFSSMLLLGVIFENFWISLSAFLIIPILLISNQISKSIVPKTEKEAFYKYLFSIHDLIDLVYDSFETLETKKLRITYRDSKFLPKNPFMFTYNLSKAIKEDFLKEQFSVINEIYSTEHFENLNNIDKNKIYFENHLLKLDIISNHFPYMLSIDLSTENIFDIYPNKEIFLFSETYELPCDAKYIGVLTLLYDNKLAKYLINEKDILTRVGYIENKHKSKEFSQKEKQQDYITDIKTLLEK